MPGSLSNLALLVPLTWTTAGGNPDARTMNDPGLDDGLLRYPHIGFLVDSLPLGVVFQDLKGQIRAANPAAEAILGLTLDQMQGQTSVDPRWHAVHEDGSPFPGEEHPAMLALATGKSLDKVVMGIFNPQRNALIWISLSARLIPREETQPIRGVYAIFEDITQRKQTEQDIRSASAALRESEAHYHAAFEGSRDAIVISRLEGGAYLDVNQGFVDITGHQRGEAFGRTAIELNISAG